VLAAGGGCTGGRSFAGLGTGRASAGILAVGALGTARASGRLTWKRTTAIAARMTATTRSASNELRLERNGMLGSSNAPSVAGRAL